MKIVVAGAGAGKTTSMADLVLERLQEKADTKIIYVITYTNSARNKIRDKIREKHGCVPSELKVETIHAFLLREVIFPFHHLLFGKHFKDISLINLPSEPWYKANKVKDLESHNIIHVDKVTQTAKWVLYKKTKDTAAIRRKREKVLSITANYLDSIFVDESQDMDDHFLETIKVLDNKGIDVTLVGDPKQDLRGKGAFRDLISNFSPIEYKPENHRSPSLHVSFSNNYITEEEAQESQNVKPGNLFYTLESNINTSDYFRKNNHDLLYIYKKNERFITNKNDVGKEERTLSYELKSLVLKASVREGIVDREVYVLKKKIMNSLPELSNFAVFSRLEKILEISMTNQDKGKLGAALKGLRQPMTNGGILVNSIDSIKGLEGNDCLFIISTDLFPYLFKEKREQNKMMNYLYVALTRSMRNLTIMVTQEVEDKYGADYIEKGFLEFGVCPPYAELAPVD